MRPGVSLPLRECGLKWLSNAYAPGLTGGLPVREGGLKSQGSGPSEALDMRHSPCGSVD